MVLELSSGVFSWFACGEESRRPGGGSVRGGLCELAAPRLRPGDERYPGRWRRRNKTTCKDTDRNTAACRSPGNGWAALCRSLAISGSPAAPCPGYGRDGRPSWVRSHSIEGLVSWPRSPQFPCDVWCAAEVRASLRIFQGTFAL